MNRKEKLNLLLSEVAEDKKDAFIAELRAAKTREERLAVAEKFGVVLTKEEARAIKNRTGNELSDEELDRAAGGCSCHSCYCTYPCGS